MVQYEPIKIFSVIKKFLSSRFKIAAEVSWGQLSMEAF